MAESKGEFLKYLLNLGIEKGDADKAADRYGKAISEISSKASKQSSSTGSSGTAGLSQAFIDQQASNIARVNVQTGEKIIAALSKTITLNPIEMAKAIISGGIDGIKAVIADITNLDKELIERVKGAGGYVGNAAQGMMDSTREAMIASQQFGVATNDTLDAVKDLMVNSERMSMYNDKTISTAMVASLAFAKNSRVILENAENFRNVGLGLDGAAKSITDIGLKSVKVGLSAKATTDTLVMQVGKLNQFGFQGGIAGLGKMVQQAQSLKINMEDVFRVADKLYDPESAINLAANLQVVGGAIGDFSDPIKLMYDATNDVGSLQTSIIGAARSLATYNAEQGRFEVTGANLRRAKAMSDALGISMGELTNMAVKGAAKMEAMSELDMFPSLSDDQKEFVSNLSTIKDGRVGFDIPKDMAKNMGLTNVVDGFVGLSDLSDDQVKLLQKLQEEAAEQTPEKIAKDQFNQTTQILNVATAIYLRMMEDTRKSSLGKAATDGMNEAAKFMEKFNPAQQSTGEITNQAIEEVSKLAKDTTELFKGKLKESIDPDILKVIDELKQKTNEMYNQMNIPEIINKGKEAGGDIIDKGIELIKEIFVNVKVDINSNNSALAGIVVDEIERTPQLKASLASSIVKGINDYA